MEAWVNRIVANRCIDHIRKYRGNNVATPFVEMTPDDSDVEFEDILENENKEFMPEESVDYGATKKIMQGILNQLSEEQRLCVLMYYYEELSISEIADTLDCSTGTVKSRLNYARKYIKNEVENLEKKGTKLYSIAPLPFLVWMLRSQENTVQVQATEKEVWQAIQDKDGVVTETKDIDDNAKHSQQIESQKAEQKTAQETARKVAKNSGKAAKTGAKGIATKIVAGVVAVALVGTGVGLGYMKQHKKPVKVAEQTKNDKKEKQATTEEKTSEKFVLTEEQIREIKVAAALFDNCFASYNTESGNRIDYSTLLDQDHISPQVIKAVARGWACTDESIGEDLGEDYEEDDISSYVSRKYMKTDECQEFLKDTFGYEADDWDEVSEVFAPSGNSHAEVFEASFDGFQSIDYNVERCEQTGEDEYHFYVKAEREEYSNTGYGLMDITAHKDEKSKFGGFVFDKIEFTANKTDDIKHDLSLIIQNMIKEDGEISGLDSQYDPIGVHEVAKFTNDQFLSYANRIIDSSRCIAKDKEYKEGEGGYGGHTLPKERFIEICENTLGWKNGNLDISSLVEGNKAHFYREDLDTISAWFGVDMMTVVQSADGSVQINGTVRDYRKESDQYDYQYNPDPRVVYSFTASGKADEKSELGTVIEKVEVLELVSGTVDSSPVQAGYTEIENKVVEAEEWKQAYIDWVNGWITKSNLATFQLFDLNGDAIPEIVAFGSDMSEGAEVATWGVGTVQTIPLDRMEAHYIPGGNVIDNSGGMSEDWYDTIYKIQDGQWVQIGNGTYSVPGPDEPDIPMEDENGNYNFINFKWNGTPMSKEDYQQQVKKLIDLDNAVFMDGENNSAVSVSEIVSQIENY